MAGLLTNAELHRLASATMRIRHAANDANSALYGVFGYGKDQSDAQDYKIRIAQRQISIIRKALDSLEGIA